MSNLSASLEINDNGVLLLVAAGVVIWLLL